MREILIYISVVDLVTMLFIDRRCGVSIFVSTQLRHRHKCLDHSMVQLVCLVAWLALEEVCLNGAGIEQHLTCVVVPDYQATLL